MKLVIERTVREEVYCISKIDQDNEVRNASVITFIDGKFSKCSFNCAESPYTRDDWRMLRELERMITDIEEFTKIEEGKAK
jgi:hypothetical protein